MPVPRLELRFLGRSRHAFRLCGYAGVIAAVALATTVVSATGNSPTAMALVSLAGALTFLALVAATVVWSGQERIVYYHHEIAVLAVAAAVAAALGEPVLPYLDATAIGLGAFLACGRTGCLNAGCCHGRARAGGVLYGPAHGDAGLADAYVGVPLFPVQAVEAAWALALAAAGTALAIGGAAPGAAAALYVSGYAVARFGLELLRGDAVRPHLAGLSQPQWLSLACTAAVVAGGIVGAVPAHPLHVVAAAGVLAAAVVVVLRRRGAGALGAPGHEQELVAAIRAALRGGDAARVLTTAAGVSVSGGRVATAAGDVAHVTLSYGERAVPSGLARTAARILRALHPGAAATEIRRAPSGVVHVVATAEPRRSARPAGAAVTRSAT